MNPFTLSFFRPLFALYLFSHFVFLIPYAAELFSETGILPFVESPFHFLPLPFAWNDSFYTALFFLFAGSLFSLFLACGYKTRVSAFSIWLILVVLCLRNPFAYNASFSFLGWILLTFCLKDEIKLQINVQKVGWIILSFYYFYSGYLKLLSPSWQSGYAVLWILENPFARDTPIRDFLLLLPDPLLKSITYLDLFAELLFAPLCLFPKTRNFIWNLMAFIQCFFFILLSSVGLSSGILFFHFFLYKYKGRPFEEPSAQTTSLNPALS